MNVTEALKFAVFAKAHRNPGQNYATDFEGRIIVFSEYGRNSDYGWEIDHIVPVALGGGDHISNLRPRHWRGNSSAGGILGDILGNFRR